MDEDPTALLEDGPTSSLHRELEAKFSKFKEKRRERVSQVEKLRAHGRELYRDSSGELALRDSIAAFVDELGFSERVTTLTDTELLDDIALYDDARLRLSNPAHFVDDALRVVYFSDNVGIGMPVTSSIPSNDLSTVLGVVANYQLNLALKGRLVRGGITRGRLYADHSFITGEALVRAVEIEKDQAVFPRVLIDQDCIDLALEDFDGSELTPGDPMFFFRDADAQNLLLREDGRVFVSYLGVLLLDEYLDLPMDFILRRHRDQILKSLAIPGQSPRINAKLRWAADYHDYFVTQVIWKPEWLVGSTQSHHFASFNLDWMRGAMQSLPITDLVVENFEHICAVADVARPVPQGAQADPDESHQILRSLVRSIEDQCELLNSQAGSSGHQSADALGELIADCRSVQATAYTEVVGIGDSLTAGSAIDALWALEKGLRVVRVDHRADFVARRALSAYRNIFA